MTAWSNVTTCLNRRAAARIIPARPQPHIFMAEAIFANSVISESGSKQALISIRFWQTGVRERKPE